MSRSPECSLNTLQTHKWGGNEVYKTVGTFAEIKVNIYSGHSSGRDVEMFLPQCFFQPSRLSVG